MYYPEWNTNHVVIATMLVLVNCSVIFREMYPSTQLKYSKFSSHMTSNQSEKMISSFYGMLLIYTPSMLVCFGLLLNSFERTNLCLISAILFLHYLKRVLEVLNVHKYSGKSKLSDNILISISYVTFSLLVYSFSSQVKSINLSSAIIGIFLFFVGEFINYYHHCILSSLRTGKSKEYQIPSKGLFQFIWCPHYAGEIITFAAIVLITQHVYVLILQLGSAGYLMMRAYNTREWYKKKFNEIPNRACLLPYVF